MEKITEVYLTHTYMSHEPQLLVSEKPLSLVVYLAFVCMLRALEKSSEINCLEQYY
jgi:hypothetical protein